MARRRRVTAILAAVSLASTAVGAVSIAPAASAAPTGAVATLQSIAYTDSAHAGKSYESPDWQKTNLPVGTTDGSTSRVYATFDLSPFLGTHLVSASLFGQAAAETDCTTAAAEIWTTDTPDGKISWHKAPAELADAASLHFGIGCPTDYLHADLSSTIVDAVNAGQKSVSLEVRVPAAHESDPSYAFSLYAYYGLRLSVAYNNAPTQPIDLKEDSTSCTPTAPYRYIGNLRPRLSATATDPDHDDQIQLNPDFQIWPTDHPDQVTDINNAYYGGIQAQVPGGLLADGGTYGWRVKVSDGVDTSPWSDTCYFHVDVTRPQNAPGVDCPNYAAGSDHALSPGNPMTFNFTPNGVDDVAGYVYDFYVGGVPQQVAANPDGTASVTVNPPTAGYIRFDVYSYDRAGNTSPQTTYEFNLNFSTPIVTTDARLNLGQPFHIEMTGNPVVAPVDYFEIRTNQGDWTRLDADSDGHASFTYQTDQQSSAEFIIRSHSTNGWISDNATVYEWVDTSPIITSDIYSQDSSNGGAGVAGTFTLTTTVPHPATITYSFDWGQEVTVDASSGSIQVPFTPDYSGSHTLYAYTTDTDGVTYDYAYYFFDVN